MSGIAGIWQLDRKPVSAESLQAGADSIKHRGQDHYGFWQKESIGLCIQQMWVTPEEVGERQPLYSGENRIVFIFDGRLDNRDELTAYYELSSDSLGLSDAAFALKLYEKLSEDFAVRFKGDFAFALYDASRDQLLLGRDAMGVRPLYYSFQNNRFVFGSEIKCLMATDDLETEPDREILADRLLNWVYDRERTFFKNILAVEPGHMIKVTRKGISKKRLWDFDPMKKCECHSFEEAKERFLHYFTLAVKRRLRSAYPVALSVSGGLDSSSLYCLADRLRKENTNLCPQFESFSWELRDGSAADEYSYVESLKGSDHSPIYPIPMVSIGPYQNAEDMVRCLEAPLLDDHWGNRKNILNAAQGKRCRTFMMGLFADQFLIDQAHLVDYFWHLKWHKIIAYVWKYRNFEALRVLKSFALNLLQYSFPQSWKKFFRRFWPKKYEKWYSTSFRANAFRRWIERKRPYKPTRSAHARSVYEQARSPYVSLCLEWENKAVAGFGMDFLCPFLDVDLIQFMISLPGEWQMWQDTKKGILRESMQGILPEKIRTRRSKAHFSFVANEAMKRDYFSILDKLMKSRNTEKWGIVDIREVSRARVKMRTELDSDRSKTAWALTDLLGLELWLQVFFDFRRDRPENKSEAKPEEMMIHER